MDIKEIKSQGFLLSSVEENIQGIAFFALKSSLMNYFSTYRDVMPTLDSIEKSNVEGSSVSYNPSYYMHCYSAIRNFHLFVEIVIKEILSKHHPLLAIDVSKKHNVLFDLLKNVNINENRYVNEKQLEFKFAKDRLKVLIESKRVDSEKYSFFKEYDDFLETLSYLRNRLIHRGAYILHYKALDFLFGKFALPFINEVAGLEEYKESESIWKVPELSANINIIKEIGDHFRSDNKYNINRIALLKELGRASYQNPILGISSVFRDIFEKREKDKANKLAQMETNLPNMIKNCPVCGNESLVLFYEDFDDAQNESSETRNYLIYNTQCSYCGFEIFHDIEDISSMNLPITDYFHEVYNDDDNPI